MPLYEYTDDSGHIRKEIRSIHDDESAEVKCAECGATMRQVIGGVAIKFNGGGFYTNDKRKR